MMRKAILGIMALGLAMVGVQHEAKAAYPEKNIKFIIPYSPGGGFDTYVRAISPVLSKHLGNKVKVIPTNIPGAGGKKGITAAYRARPDGYTIAIFNFPGIALAQLKGDPIKYDLTKVTWMAQIGTDKYGFAVRGNGDIKSIDDLKKMGRPIKFTSTGKSTTSHVVSVIGSNAFGIEAKMITGYKGSKKSILGAIRGDGDAVMMVLGTLDPFVRSGDLRLVATFTASEAYPGVPTAKDLGVDGLENLGIARMVGGPPGIPNNVRNVLSEALYKALTDPELQAWSKKAKRAIVPLNAADAEQAVQAQMKFMGQYKHLF